MLKGTRLPEKAFMLAFLRACGVQNEQLDRWQRGWERIADAKARAQPTPVEISRPVLRSVSTREGLPGSIGHSPIVRRRELGGALREFRIRQRLTVDQVAERLLCSPSKVSRMETGRRGITSRDVRDLCDLYGVVDQAERDRLMMLAREGHQQAWWQSYDLSYAMYVGLEAGAVSISCFQSSVVPGLLQTADYARAGHERAMPKFDPDEIERQIEAKLVRQRRLTMAEPLSFVAVLDEAVLHRLTGGPTVMQTQLKRLMEAALLPNVTIQVIPFAVGAHPALESNFSILELSTAPGVVYAEGLAGSIYLERQEDLERYRRIFGRLRRLALGPEDTVDMLAGMCI
jgi:transcriptional regulator with XRE-family HTH domain